MISSKSIPAAFFASYVFEENRPDSSARVCNIRMTKLKIPKEYLKRLNKEVFIALYYGGPKHPLRSTPILLPENSTNTLEIDIDLSFSIKYPHYYGRQSNYLHIVLQKTRTYHSKVISAFKTLAIGVIDLEWIIQCSNINRIKLSSKSTKMPSIVINFSHISSLPSEKGLVLSTKKMNTSNQLVDALENSSQSGSDIEMPYIVPILESKKYKKHKSLKLKTIQHETLKKVLGKLKIASDLKESILTLANAHSAEDNHSENDSFDDSICSLDDDYCATYESHKPVVRPHFQAESLEGSTHSSTNSMSESFYGNMNKTLDEDTSLFPNPPVNASSFLMNEEIPTGIPNQSNSAIADVLPKPEPQNKDIINILNEDDTVRQDYSSSLKEYIRIGFEEHNNEHIYFTVILVSTYHNKEKIKKLHSLMGSKLIVLGEEQDIKLMFSAIIAQLQNFKNISNNSPLIKICILGREPSLTLYVQQLSQFSTARLAEILELIQFLIIPIGKGKIASFIGKKSNLYSSLFLEQSWSDCSSETNINDTSIMANRIMTYIHSKTTSLALPISEICLNCVSNNSEEQTSFQINVPFIISVNIGGYSLDNIDSEYAEYVNKIPSISSSGLNSYNTDNTPNSTSSVLPMTDTQGKDLDKLELNIDYWISNVEYGLKENEKKRKEEKKEIKISYKSDYKYATIYRNKFIQDNENCQDFEYLSMNVKKYVNRKSQFSIKKKSKEQKVCTKIEQIGRIVCASKSNVFTVEVDGRYWNGVKFFSIYPKRSANLKSFRIGIPST